LAQVQILLMSLFGFWFAYHRGEIDSYLLVFLPVIVPSYSGWFPQAIHVGSNVVLAIQIWLFLSFFPITTFMVGT
jgi:hypothetical protein